MAIRKWNCGCQTMMAAPRILSDALIVHLRSPEMTASFGGHPSPVGGVSSLRVGVSPPSPESCAKDGLPSEARSRIQASEGWYRYGDSNPGPVAENHVS